MLCYVIIGLDELGQTFYSSSGLCISSIRTGTRCIMHPDELPFVMHCSRRISKESSSRTIVLFVNHPRIKLDRNTNVRLILSSINIIKKDKFSSTFFRIQR